MHVLTEYSPPRSWDQFEVLCADVFQSAWQDPAMVRHGRGGQRQDGVDIIGRNGAIYPIGLQCKRRSRWPVSLLKVKDIEEEITAAKNFRPKLKAFYILPRHSTMYIFKSMYVRKLRSKKAKSFEVILLGLGEILHLATKDSYIAYKHF